MRETLQVSSAWLGQLVSALYRGRPRFQPAGLLPEKQGKRSRDRFLFSEQDIELLKEYKVAHDAVVKARDEYRETLRVAKDKLDLCEHEYERVFKKIRQANRDS